jgi:hypothetical protein
MWWGHGPCDGEALHVRQGHHPPGPAPVSCRHAAPPRISAPPSSSLSPRFHASSMCALPSLSSAYSATHVYSGSLLCPLCVSLLLIRNAGQARADGGSHVVRKSSAVAKNRFHEYCSSDNVHCSHDNALCIWQPRRELLRVHDKRTQKIKVSPFPFQKISK